ncbi:MAG: hypothetical protein V1723_02930 [Candidatus Uhrbacteria bacterium]
MGRQTSDSATSSSTSSSAPLTQTEQNAWEERLGWESNSTSAWGRLVGDYLFAQPRARRLPHLVHALRVLPYVRSVASERFTAEAVSERIQSVCVRRRVSEFNRRHELLTAGEKHPSAAEFASEFIDFLEPLTSSERAFFIGHVFCRLSITPYSADRCPCARNQQPERRAESKDDNQALLLAHRELVLEMRAIIDHCTCEGREVSTVMADFLAVLDRVKDPHARALIMSHAIALLFVKIGPSPILIPLPFGIPTEGRGDGDAASGEDDPLARFMRGREPKAKA